MTIDQELKNKNLKNRRWLIDRVRCEVVGPDPVGPQVLADHASDICLTWEQFRNPMTTESGEEVLWQDPPAKRYGSGILFPRNVRINEQTDENVDPTGIDSLEEGSGLNDRQLRDHQRLQSRSDAFGDSSEEQEVNRSDQSLPSVMSLSFLADFSLVESGLVLELVSVSRNSPNSHELAKSPVGRYATVKAHIQNVRENQTALNKTIDRTLYKRQSILDQDGAFPRIEVDKIRFLTEQVLEFAHPEVDDLRFRCISRPWQNSESLRLITVTIENLASGGGNTKAFFQAGFSLTNRGEQKPWIRPYPEHSQRQQAIASIEERILRLNYRNHKSFAVGHGTGSDWNEPQGGLVSSVWTDCMPLYEMPATTPDLQIVDENRQKVPLKISMRKLSGIDGKAGQLNEIGLLLSEYGKWIARRESEAESDAELDKDACSVILDRLKHCKRRVEVGLEMLRNNDNPAILRAFELANLAMYIAQSRQKKQRNPKFSDRANLSGFDRPYQKFNLSEIPEDVGYWRPFQAAFLLLSIEGLVHTDSPDREEVDLIWFPTGGGKTEAYLGVIAFLLFYKRLIGSHDAGITVLMRYTLRLLTAQQFERATTLFCAMELIRTEIDTSLGDKQFSIGLWVGLAASPNHNQKAQTQLKKLRNDADSDNPFILRRCPWCCAGFGVFSTGEKQHEVLGYVAENETVRFRCPDHECKFSDNPDPLMPQKGDPLPVSVIDEDLFANPPDMLIATVDKFALLPWNPNIRVFFGIGSDGEYKSASPSLIIQDELHLISGPLGTIVGAYETVIEELCSAGGQRPKLIASTATISNAEEQIKNLYAREAVTIFPPVGFEANESFFSQVSREKDGTQSPGRIYCGVMAPAYRSLQTTQARVFASLLQWPVVPDWSEEERDPWWTLLCFFNSLRELGSAATLLIADTRDYLRVILGRHGLDYETQFRTSLFPSELTSRIPSHRIPEMLNQLEIPYTNYGEKDAERKHPMDVCLASSIIEVGIDIPRLSLMALIGQPKTTAQYIQVSSRIGREVSRPGLVFTLYSSAKARDISHYEKFKNYHQRVYSYVEPTSVTPFSIPAVERTLHALAVSLIRQRCDLDTLGLDPSRDIPESLKKWVVDVIDARVTSVSPDDHAFVMKTLDKRIRQWETWAPDDYGVFMGLSEDPSLMYQAGQTPPTTWDTRSWATLSSMRGVDASSEAKITDHFNTLLDE